MAEYKLRGTEDRHTGEEHLWITKDGKSMPIEDVVDDLLWLQEQLHFCRQLLETACDAWECGHVNSLLHMQQLHLTGAWYEAARDAAGGGDEDL
jgi:hypothetical protein